MNINSLESLRETIQDDLLCLLDGFESELQDAACQIIVNRFKIFLDNTTLSIKDPESIWTDSWNPLAGGFTG